jgi:hypothetical protein
MFPWLLWAHSSLDALFVGCQRITFVAAEKPGMKKICVGSVQPIEVLN